MASTTSATLLRLCASLSDRSYEDFAKCFEFEQLKSYGDELRRQVRKPGHPVYDRLRRKWAGESYTDIQEVRASLKRKFMDFRELVLARQAAEAAAAAEVAEAALDDPETRPC